jgi:hypothetical protein
MDDLEQVSAFRTLVDDLVEGIVAGATGNAAKDRAGHGL